MESMMRCFDIWTLGEYTEIRKEIITHNFIEKEISEEIRYGILRSKWNCFTCGRKYRLCNDITQRSYHQAGKIGYCDILSLAIDPAKFILPGEYLVCEGCYEARHDAPDYTKNPSTNYLQESKILYPKRAVYNPSRNYFIGFNFFYSPHHQSCLAYRAEDLTTRIPFKHIDATLYDILQRAAIDARHLNVVRREEG